MALLSWTLDYPAIKQATFASLTFDAKKKRTRREMCVWAT